MERQIMITVARADLILRYILDLGIPMAVMGVAIVLIAWIAWKGQKE